MNFREQYNYNLKKMYEIEKIINANPEKYDELYPAFDKFTKALSKMELDCKNKYNYIMSVKEILNGFEGVN